MIKLAGFLGNIEELTLANNNFRQVLFTGAHTQLVLMSIEPGGEIGTEIHEIVDQFLRIEQGQGKIVMDGQERPVKDGDAFIVPAGVQHNVINTGSEPLKLYTLYSPPHHKDGTIHKTRTEAEADNADHI